jgi:hypothetical protein
LGAELQAPLATVTGGNDIGNCDKYFFFTHTTAIIFAKGIENRTKNKKKKEQQRMLSQLHHSSKRKLNQ